MCTAGFSVGAKNVEANGVPSSGWGLSTGVIGGMRRSVPAKGADLIHAAPWMDLRGILLGEQPHSFWKWPQRWRAGQRLPGARDGVRVQGCGGTAGAPCDCDPGADYRDCWWEKMTGDTHTHGSSVK